MSASVTGAGSDPSEFPMRLTMDAELCGGWSGVLTTPRRSIDLEDIRSVYYRKPSVFRFPDGMSEADRKWALREARIGFGGLLVSLPDWLNHPTDIARAEFKPAQLQAAVRAGLRVPRTLLTNDPAAVRRFAGSVGRVVYKPLSGPAHVANGETRFLYTTVVDESEFGDPGIALTAHLFQEWVPKQFEVRLTVVDGRFFAARIDAGSEQAAIDWRSDYDHLAYQAIEVPDAIRCGVMRLISGFCLRFGALDFVVTPEDEWVLLELNPNGQWAWIEEKAGLPIAAAIADSLVAGKP